MQLRLYNFDTVSDVLGPNKRAVIWTQGCPFNCINCMTPKSIGINGGIELDIKVLADEINKIDGIEGITISGGEPFIQSKSLYNMLKLIKKDLGVIVYTGFEYEKIRNDKLMSKIDLLIDGKYIDELNDGIAYRGSSNQRAIFLTNRYKKFKDKYNSYNRKIEIRIKDGVEIIGIPSKKTLKRIKCGL